MTSARSPVRATRARAGFARGSNFVRPLPSRQPPLPKRSPLLAASAPRSLLPSVLPAPFLRLLTRGCTPACRVSRMDRWTRVSGWRPVVSYRTVPRPTLSLGAAPPALCTQIEFTLVLEVSTFAFTLTSPTPLAPPASLHRPPASPNERHFSCCPILFNRLLVGHCPKSLAWPVRQYLLSSPCHAQCHRYAPEVSMDMLPDSALLRSAAYRSVSLVPATPTYALCLSIL
jgi:hypothetical protein